MHRESRKIKTEASTKFTLYTLSRDRLLEGQVACLKSTAFANPVSMGPAAGDANTKKFQ